MTEWQSTETALDDPEVHAGKPVLVRLAEPIEHDAFGWPGGRRLVTIAAYCGEAWCAVDTEMRGGFQKGDEPYWACRLVNPTGWMPLPEP